MGDQEIRNIAKGCQTAIAVLLAATKDDDSHVEDLVNEREIEEMQERFDQTAGPIIDSDTDLAEYDISSSDSDSAISSTSSFGDVPQATSSTSEIQELMSAIKISLDYLFKASAFIRKFAPKDKRQRASNTKPFDNRADAMYINDRYPLVAEKNEAGGIELFCVGDIS
ncbi:hypothetical protein MRS44_015626 [Fusarium solani]|uniref:uncharacterized protein n=1 Tax=Fusarium solani TaxID=169388 RepID=UPI0032C466C8|nr:hypothetical protein MRS44_015626 [Fusarium solani]